MLESHLANSPRDVDARLLYGVVLSWDGRYDDAGRELRRVLDQTPTYNDARVALANMAWWTGDYSELHDLADDRAAASGPTTWSGCCSTPGRSTAWAVCARPGRP